jgi:choline dehydrogenase-like flavoprotein
MTLFSRREDDLIRAVVAAFRPPDFPVAVDDAVTRAIRFLSALDEGGSERLAEIRRILGFLDLALAFVDLGDRQAVRERLDAIEEQDFPFNVDPNSRGLARFAQRLAILCLYSTLGTDQRPTAALQLGYKLFKDRGYPGADAPVREETLPPEIFIAEGDPVPDHVYDVVVIGSGSAGSVLVRRLVEGHGLDVALIEAGDYVAEGKDTPGGAAQPRPLVHDEMENLLRYYKHGGLQLTEGLQMFIFQGQCLGGSSVVNNAVCFRMPTRIRELWADRYGIPWAQPGSADLDDAYARIALDLGIRSAADVTDRLNPSGKYLRAGAAALTGRPPGDALKPCEVNLTHDPKCLGCGYCNLTCGYLRKRSVLQTMLPAAARSASGGRGSLTIFTGRVAASIKGTGSPFQAAGVHVVGRRKRNPSTGLVSGRKVVVSAGAIASTGILERTPEIAKTGLPFGDRFSFNFGSPIHAEFKDPVHAWDGLQIAHYFDDRLGDGFVIETWYNPPATQALALPGWMDRMLHNLSRYDYYACAAPLVGSTARSSVDKRGGERGERIHVQLRPRDLDRLKHGLVTTCEMFLAHDPKPTRLLIGTLDDWELNEQNYRDRIRRIESFGEIQIGTGHPQGGNSLSSNDASASQQGVVSPDFAVHDTRSLFVVDASVFPTSLGVNPHWTVMALADLASRKIAGA